MLQDEIKPLRALISELTLTVGPPDEVTMIRPVESVPAVRAVCHEIRIAWLKAFFSEAGDQRMKRYFNFHQERIREVSDSLFLFSQNGNKGESDEDTWSLIHDTICALIVHIESHHTVFFDNQLNSPLYWRAVILRKCASSLSFLIRQVMNAAVDDQLKNCLVTYLMEMQQYASGGFCSFYAISYFEAFILKLKVLFSTEGLIEEELDNVLSGLDFNRLDYFLYKCSTIKSRCAEISSLQDQVHYLQEKKIQILTAANRLAPKCQAAFPSLTSMLESWLDEEMVRILAAVQRSPVIPVNISPKKIPLNLSVAQIACLIRILHFCKIISDSTLADIFRFVSAHFSSKMREQISEEA